jgi:RNA polymerase sigma factor (sigma-70 family)
VLRQEQDAEDAFQATFLVLARKAASIRKRESVASWLYGVAYRTAVEARETAFRRRRREREVPTMSATDPAAEAAWSELQPVLDEELQRLPEKYRRPLILCYLEGKTHAQAAAELGWPAGSMSRRLARGRDLLRQFLARRGLSVSAATLAALLGAEAAPAAVSLATVSATVAAGLRFAAGKSVAGAASAQAVTLAQGVLHAMALSKIKTAVLLLVAMTVLGMGVLALPAAGGKRGPEVAGEPGTPLAKNSPSGSKAVSPAQPGANRRRLPGDAAAAKMTVTGQVLGRKGKPVGGAEVAVLGRPRPPDRSSRFQNARYDFVQVLGQGKADAQGRFRLRVARTSRATHLETWVVARAAGHCLGQDRFVPDAGRPTARPVLGEEQVLRGRLRDLQGQSVRGVRVVATQVAGPLPGKQTFAAEFQEPPLDLRAWVPAVTGDAQGRFTLRGLGPGWMVSLTVVDDRFARQRLLINPWGRELALLREYRREGGILPYVRAKPNPAKKEDFTWTLTPALRFEGTVTYADTRKPVAGARLVACAGQQSYSLLPGTRVTARTDARGKFRLSPHAGKFYVFVVYPSEGTPYLLRTEFLPPVPADVTRKKVHFELTRGVLVTGTVTDKASSKPVPGASVEFLPQALLRRELMAPIDEFKQVGRSGPDGKFRLAVPPAPGHLLINGPTLDYLRVATDQGVLGGGKPSGLRYYPNALVFLPHKPGVKTRRVAVTLRRGVTVEGKMVGPDGKPVRGAILLAPFYLPYGYTHFPPRILHATKGTFRLAGCDPDRPQPVYLLNTQEGLGLVLHLAGKQARGKPLTVRLRRCGSARVRFVDAKGKPIANLRPWVALQMTPGGLYYEANQKVVADEANLGYDNESYRKVLTDANGRCTIPKLIPGATYRLTQVQTAREILPVLINKTFRVEAGKTLDLKDIVINVPPGKAPPKEEKEKSPDKTKADAKKELKKFQGAWVPVSLEINGRALPRRHFQNIRLTIQGNKVFSKAPGPPQGAVKTTEMVLAINPAKDPKTIDLTTVGENGKGLKTAGIFKFDGGRLTMCLGKPGGKRPGKFSSKDGTRDEPIYLQVFKRVAVGQRKVGPE